MRPLWLPLLAGCVFITPEEREERAALLAAADTAQRNLDTAPGGDDDDDEAPGPVPGEWLEVSVGLAATCAVRTSGELACWAADPPYDPVSEWLPAVPSGSDFVGVSVGRSAGCAWNGAGEVRCFGEADHTGYTPAAKILASPGTFTQVSCGSGSCCGVEAGQLSCWDLEPKSPSIGLENTTGLARVVLWGGGCTLSTTGVVDCWDFLSTGGDDPTDNAGVSDLAMADNGFLCMAQGGALRCHDLNQRLGETALVAPPSPSLEHLQAMSNGDTPYACGLLSGEVKCFGTNDNQRAFPTPPSGPWERFSSRDAVACAINAEHQLICWGDGSHRPR